MLRSFAVDIIKRMLQRRLDPEAYLNTEAEYVCTFSSKGYYARPSLT